MTNIESETFVSRNFKVYEMTTDDPNDADESLLECIKECLGARLSKLELQGCSDASFERIEKLLEV